MKFSNETSASGTFARGAVRRARNPPVLRIRALRAAAPRMAPSREWPPWRRSRAASGAVWRAAWRRRQTLLTARRRSKAPPSRVRPEPPSAFHLKPEWQGPCGRTEAVDVNLGNSPEAFVRAAYCQITGQEPPPRSVEQWAGRLRQDGHVRRVDVVRAIASEQKRQLKLSYSDPWAEEPELVDAPLRVSKRDIGAVFMFFFNCPAGVNCDMNWANTHALGMDAPHPLLGNGPAPGGEEPASTRRPIPASGGVSSSTRSTPACNF